MTDLAVTLAVADDADEVLRVVHEAFAARPYLDPPAPALAETASSVADTLDRYGGLIVHADGRAVGAMLFGTADGAFRLRRVSALPSAQTRGIASAMVGVAESVAAERGFDDVELDARRELPETLRFWHRRGYRELHADGSLLTYGKALPAALSTSDAETTRAAGRTLGTWLRAGDVLVLTGDLGAGKTTLLQGLGNGLCVRGPITSPTFVLSRIHPSLATGPALVHVDAYRLASAGELDDLDLDAHLATSVVAVEWGERVAEGLSEDRLHVRIDRPHGDSDDDHRHVTVTPVGARWLGRGLRSSLVGVRL